MIGMYFLATLWVAYTVALGSRVQQLPQQLLERQQAKLLQQPIPGQFRYYL